jgi:hypothetical protein
LKEKVWQISSRRYKVSPALIVLAIFTAVYIALFITFSISPLTQPVIEKPLDSSGTAAPVVVDNFPVQNAKEVPLNTFIQVAFNKPVNPTSTQENFSVTPSISGDFAWNSDDTEMKFTPKSLLTNGIVYNVTVRDATDKKGENMTSSYSWIFMTSPEPVDAEPEYPEPVSLPNPNLNVLTFYNDNFSDSNGFRAFPWGIENWSGAPAAYFDGGSPYGVVRLIGDSLDDSNCLAIPNTLYKPQVVEGVNYTQSFEVKLVNVTGKYGVRVIHQWFNSSSFVRFQSDYGKFENGTSDWHVISLSGVAPPNAVLGDPILELWGTGTVYIRNPAFYAVTPDVSSSWNQPTSIHDDPTSIQLMNQGFCICWFLNLFILCLLPPLVRRRVNSFVREFNS